MFAFAFGKGLWGRKFGGSEGETVTYLGPGVEFEGKIKVATGVIRVNTRVKGDVVSDGLVIVGDRGEVEASIHAKTVSVAAIVLACRLPLLPQIAFDRVPQVRRSVMGSH